MSATYNEMLKRLIEERKRLGLSQQQMARLVHITQSNYSKVEKGLHRLSYEELKYLSKANIDIFIYLQDIDVPESMLRIFNNVHMLNCAVI